MGYFTWTDGNRKPRIITDRYGCKEYHRADVVGYDQQVIVVCPDDTEIIEPSYYGYGIFGGRDIYELVVDWNKEYLADIFAQLERDNPGGYFGQGDKEIAIAYQQGNDNPSTDRYWKRDIGIAIACTNNANIPFPIKMTRVVHHKPYAEMYPSISTQWAETWAEKEQEHEQEYEQNKSRSRAY